MTATRIRSMVRDAVGRFGVDLVPYRSPRHAIGRRLRVLGALGVDLVIDVGANSGQYGRELRACGYRGQILSFEPLSGPYAILERRAHGDPAWDIVRLAIGSEAGRKRLNVAANGGASSSFLSMLALHELNAPEARFVSVEEVAMQRLDVAAARSVADARSPFLKVDVQGYELEVLRGAAGILDRVVAMQLEMSLAPLYHDGPLFGDLLTEVSGLGFELVGLEPGFAAVDGRLLQVDGLFARKTW